jgi:hypothetical protein
MLDDENYNPEPTPTGRNDAGAARLIPPAFVRRVVAAMNESEPLPGRRLNTHARGYLAKFWYGEDGSVHYEIWIHERTQQIELGLHFESTPDYNQSLYRAFDTCIFEIQQKLGASFWLEDWDRGWVRMYETHPLQPLDTYRVDEIAARLCEIIATLQPVYDEIAETLLVESRLRGKGSR